MSLTKSGIGIALLVSVALNLLVLGAAGGMFVANMRHQATSVHEPPAPRPSDLRTPPHVGAPQNFRFNPRVFIRALPKDERRLAIRKMRQAARPHQQLNRDIRKTRIELGKLLAADPLDDAKVEATLARLRTLDTQAQEMGQMIILDILRDLDPQTRRQVIAAASRRPSAPPQRPRKPSKTRERPHD